MKNKLILATLFSLFFFVGCGDDEKKVEKEKERMAGETPEELLGRWVLTGYGSEKGIVPVEGNCKDYCEITFNVNNYFTGFTELNNIGVMYNIYLSSQEIEITKYGSTENKEKCNWDLFKEATSKITHYDFASKGKLYLYFNNKKDWLILEKYQSNILTEIPKFKGKGNIKAGEQKVIQTKEELLAVFSQETISKVTDLKKIDFSSQTLLLGCASKTTEAKTFRYRYSQVDATTYRLFVEISGMATFSEGIFKYGVVVSKIPQGATVKFKIIIL